MIIFANHVTQATDEVIYSLLLTLATRFANRIAVRRSAPPVSRFVRNWSSPLPFLAPLETGRRPSRFSLRSKLVVAPPVSRSARN